MYHKTLFEKFSSGSRGIKGPRASLPGSGQLSKITSEMTILGTYTMNFLKMFLPCFIQHKSLIVFQKCPQKFSQPCSIWYYFLQLFIHTPAYL